MNYCFTALKLQLHKGIKFPKTINRNLSNFGVIRRNVRTCIVSNRFLSDQSQFKEFVVDFEHVRNATNNKNTMIIDVREPDEIKEHGKIPNSINIPLGLVSTALNMMSDMEFEQTYNRPKPSEDTEIIFYCMIGKRSGMAQVNANKLGYKNVKNYVGSWTDWARNIQ